MRNRRKRVTAMFGVFGVLVITTSMCANTNIAKANEVDSVFEQQNGIESQFSATPETFIDSMLSVSGSSIGVEKEDEREAETFSEGEGSTDAKNVSEAAIAVLPMPKSEISEQTKEVTSPMSELLEKTEALPVSTSVPEKKADAVLVPDLMQQATIPTSKSAEKKEETSISEKLAMKSEVLKVPKLLKPEALVLDPIFVSKEQKMDKQKKVKKMYSTGFICVRKKKSKSSKEVTHLLPEKKVKVTKISGKWAKVKVKKSGKKWINGYVMKKYLSTSKKKASKKANNLAENFRITGYCPCKQCSEGYGHSTKSGRRAKENHTIATDWRVLPKDTEVYVEGMGTYTVDDVGGGVKGRHIDVFVENHEETNVVTYRCKKIYELQG